MLEGLAVPGLSQCQRRVFLPLAALMGPQETGDLKLSQAKSDCGQEKHLGFCKPSSPLPFSPLHPIPSLLCGCYCDCNLYIEGLLYELCMVDLKIKNTSSRGESCLGNLD